LYQRLNKEIWSSIDFLVGMMFDLGLEQTGRFETVMCIEKEKAFCDTF
jgi:hypothetical protein